MSCDPRFLEISSDLWPMYFRANFVRQLESILTRCRPQVPDLLVPGIAKRAEECAFNNCSTREEYFRTILKVINTLNPDSDPVVAHALNNSHFLKVVADNEQASNFYLQPTRKLLPNE
ncbi:mediator of RNA polymerase II transcription subunit 15 [Ditylenchus destructor]|uniref:Mediator of RNA polymerase II transcription subunit 15 n=1 Tax=Ditylenchus destructor TaxID=166010 RepID=A0AAD4MT39_9BILA|nr:mediator of RNA polymerase II transcription subunit 15 [Ditylenchus destructor]